jgi:hypothetical protein
MRSFQKLAAALLALACTALVPCTAWSGEQERNLEARVNALESQMEQLRSDLSEFRYLGLNPKLSFGLRDVRFQEPDKLKEPPSVRYTYVVREHAPNFPLQHYKFRGKIAVLDQEGRKRMVFEIKGEMRDGETTVSGARKLYQVNQLNVDGFTLDVEEYVWHPDASLAPFEPKDR